MKMRVKGILSVLFLFLLFEGFSQDGSAGIQAATTNLVTYFAVGVTLLLIACVVEALRVAPSIPSEGTV